MIMKTLLKSISAVAMVLMLSLGAKAQTSDNIFDPKLPMTWLGLDFSKAKFIGPSRDFGLPEKHKELMASWNSLLDREQDKFSVKRFFRKQTVTLDFNLTNKNNGPLDIGSMIVEKSEGAKPALEEKDIREIVSNYDFGGLRGLGLMLVVESFDKSRGKSNVWITFINLNTQEVIMTERRFGSPMGASLKSFWVNSILNMMERISRKDWDTWQKGNYKLIDGPVVAKKTQATSTVKEPPIPKTAEVVRSIPEAKVSNTMAASPVVRLGGKYFALLIGVSNYMDDRLNLDNPVKDARRIKQVLTEEYN